MKRLFAALWAAILLLNLCACQSAQPQSTEQPQAPTATEPAPTETRAPTEAPSEPAPTEPEGVLLLSVSKITLSLVGDSEDIYRGTADPERVEWESGDESVVLVENGVLTAAGVGTTTVKAAFRDETLECQVTCLAETQEELAQLPREVLHAPKRIPPVADDTVCTFFDDAAFVGDSISYTLQHRAPVTGVIGSPVFLVRGGVSLYGFEIGSKKITMRGVETNLEDAVEKTGVKKLFVMMGQNDVSYRTVDETIESLAVVLGRVWEKNPEVEVYIQSLVPEWADHLASNKKNEKIDEYNRRLRAFTELYGCHYVEVADYFKDNTNRMPTEYSSDKTIHINADGADVWMQVLRAYVKELEAKGEA